VTNIIEAELTGQEIQTLPVFQFDYGTQLHIVGAPIEAGTALYADLSLGGYKVERVSINSEYVDIPAPYFATGDPVFVFVVMETETARRTLHKITIPVLRRPSPPKRPEQLGPYTWPNP
jgi:hypothetical protein